MTAAGIAEGVTRAVLEELVAAIVAGTDERAAIARAVEQLRATEVHGPISAGVEARIARVVEQHAATEARVSVADVDILRRLATQHALTLEERGAVTRTAHWIGARLAIPLPMRLDSERAEAPIPEGEP